MSLTIFLPKLNTAQVYLDFNYLSLLATGETITGAAVDASVASGTDPLPQNIVSGTEIITGPVVSQLIIGGVVGVIYLLNCTISTSLGNTVLLQGHLAILDRDPYQP